MIGTSAPANCSQIGEGGFDDPHLVSEEDGEVGGYSGLARRGADNYRHLATILSNGVAPGQPLRAPATPPPCATVPAQDQSIRSVEGTTQRPQGITGRTNRTAPVADLTGRARLGYDAPQP